MLGQVQLREQYKDIPIQITDLSEPGNSTGGLIQVSNQYPWTDNLNLVNPGAYGDIYTVLLHEMGHIFGANHSTSLSVMNYSFYQAKRALTDCDKSSLVAVYNPMYYVKVKNDFAGGQIKVEYTTYTNVPDTGLAPFNWRRTAFPKDLIAINNQIPPDGYKRVWKQWNDGTLNITKTLSTAGSGTYEAQFRREFNVVFQNNFINVGNGGTINVNGQSYSSPTIQFQVVEQDAITASAQGQGLNGIEYTFTQWSDGYPSSYRTFYPSAHSTYTANFIGKPSNYGESVHFGPDVGQPIVIYWTDNINGNVTQYQIWRRVKHNGVVGPDTHIGTVGSGVQTFTDYDYLLTSTYSDDLLWYDVRAYYSIEGTYSDPQWSAVYGEMSFSERNEPIIALEISNELPTQYRIDNYPNPFNPSTTINYQLPENGFVTIKVFDILGKEVETLVNENKSAGYYKVNFDGGNLTSGVYIYSIQVNGITQSKKMLLAK